VGGERRAGREVARTLAGSRGCSCLLPGTVLAWLLLVLLMPRAAGASKSSGAAPLHGLILRLSSLALAPLPLPPLLLQLLLLCPLLMLLLLRRPLLPLL